MAVLKRSACAKSQPWACGMVDYPVQSSTAPSASHITVIVKTHFWFYFSNHGLLKRCHFDNLHVLLIIITIIIIVAETGKELNK